MSALQRDKKAGQKFQFSFNMIFFLFPFPPRDLVIKFVFQPWDRFYPGGNHIKTLVLKTKKNRLKFLDSALPQFRLIYCIAII